jgi:hypothetical protein
MVQDSKSWDSERKRKRWKASKFGYEMSPKDLCVYSLIPSLWHYRKVLYPKEVEPSGRKLGLFVYLKNIRTLAPSPSVCYLVTVRWLMLHQMFCYRPKSNGKVTMDWNLHNWTKTKLFSFFSSLFQVFCYSNGKLRYKDVWRAFCLENHLYLGRQESLNVPILFFSFPCLPPSFPSFLPSSTGVWILGLVLA